jgi:hypothetical protein
MRASKPFALLIAALLGGCGVQTAVVGGDGAPIGTVRVTSATFANVALTPAACNSGEHQLFLGADFLDRARGTAVRLILGPEGEATLRVFDTARPLEPGILFPRVACSKALIAFERTGWQINDIHDIRVSLDVDCRNASGDSLQGTLSVAHCH